MKYVSIMLLLFSCVFAQEMPSLIQKIKSDDLEIKLRAIASLPQQEEKALVVIPVLVDMYSEHDSVFKDYIVEIIAEMGSEAIEAVAELCFSSDRNTSIVAIEILELMGPKAKIAIPYLVKLLDSEQKGYLACTALAKIGKDAIPYLIRATKSANQSYTSIAAMIALGEITPPTNQTIEFLIKAFNADMLGRRLFANTMGKIGLPAIPYLVALINPNMNSELEIACEDSLVKIGIRFPRQVLSALKPIYLLEPIPSVKPISSSKISPQYFAERIYSRLKSREVIFHLEKKLQYGFWYNYETPYAQRDLHLQHSPSQKDIAFISLQTRKQAAHDLSKMPHPHAIPVLEQALQNPDKEIQIYAAIALVRMRKCNKKILHLLLENIETDKNFLGFRPDILDVLIPIAPKARSATPVLLRLWKKRPHFWILKTLVYINPKQSLPILRKILQDKKSYAGKRIKAYQLLQILGKKTQKATPDLLQLLRDNGIGKDERESILFTLSNIEVLSEEGVPVLVEMVEQSKVLYKRMLIAHTLSIVGRDSESLIPVLIKWFYHEDESIHRAAFVMLKQMGPHAVKILPRLISSLEDKRFRTSAIRALGCIGPKAKPAVSKLLPLLKHNEFHIRLFTAETLIQIGEETEVAIDVLELCLQDPIPYLSSQAAKALGEAGKKARKVVPLLIRTSQSKNTWLRHQSVEALGHIGSDEAIPTLIHIIENDSNQSVREKALMSIGRIKVKNKRVIDFLIKQLQNGDEFIRIKAIEAMSLIGPNQALSHVIEVAAYEDPSDLVRRAAMKVIAQME